MFLLTAASNDADSGLSAKPEDIEEIDAALNDLNDDPNMGSFGSGPYWPKIRERLLSVSNSQDAKEAVKEWKYIRMWLSSNGQCDLCDHHPLVYHFQIENRVNGNRMILGSECIGNYLQIEGVPSKEVLKKRLNQLRSMAKAKEKGTVGENAMELLEEIQTLEREVNILIGRVSRPDPDIDVLEYIESLNVPLFRLNALGTYSLSNKTVAEIVNEAKGLHSFLLSIQKRSSKYKTATMLPAVEAIMRFRDFGEKKAMLEQLRKRINATFKLGAAEEAVEMIWAEVRIVKKDVRSKYLSAVEDVKSEIQKMYTPKLDLLKPYPHLSFTFQAGITALKGIVDEQARANVEIIDTIETAAKIDRATFGSWMLRPGAFQYTLEKFRQNSLVRETWNLLLFMGMAVDGRLRFVRPLEEMFKVRIKDIAGIPQAMLKAADDGEIDLDKTDRDVLSNPKVIARFEEEVDEIKNRIHEAEGKKVWEAMAADLKFDVQKFYKGIDVTDQWLADFSRSIFAQWKRGMQNGISFKQRNIIERELGKGKSAGRSVWDELESQFNARSQAKFAFTYAR